MTVDDLLVEAPERSSASSGPAEGLAAQAKGALLVDIRGDDQSRAGRLNPVHWYCPATPWNGAAIPHRRGGTRS
jgi:hypothetical protein